MFLHITHCKKRLNALSTVMDKLELDFRSVNKFREFTEIKSFKIYSNITRKLEKKLQGLKKNERIIHKHNRENWSKNL